jgi:hypothetical protein
MEYVIHKGTSKSVELLGLKNQYLIRFCIGVVGVFFLFVLLRMVNMPLVVSILVVGACLGGLLRYVFSFNKKYGQHGLMKKNARTRYPSFVTSRKSFYLMLGRSRKCDV